MSTLREQLNAKLPWETIVRNPKQTSIDEIDTDYYQNVVEVAEFVRESVGYTDRVSEEFRATLENGFEEWILECHRIMCTGKDGTREYHGQADDIKAANYAGQLRKDNEVHYRFDPTILELVYDVAIEAGDQFTRGTKTFTEWQEKAKSEFLTYHLIPGAVTDAESIENLKADGAFGTTHYAEEDDLIVHGFPDHTYIGDYLKIMNAHLGVMANALDEGDENRAFASMCKYYATGIRSQAVPGVWNSVLMTQANEFLDMMGLKRTHHLIWDVLSFTLETDNFTQYFASHMQYKPT